MRRCFAAGVLWTRHPKVGAAKRRAALVVNVFAPRKLRNLGRSRALAVPVCELIENKRVGAVSPSTRLQEFGNRPLRRSFRNSSAISSSK